MPDYEIDPADVDWTDTAIEEAAQVMCDGFGGNDAWGAMPESVQDVYRDVARRLVAAGWRAPSSAGDPVAIELRAMLDEAFPAEDVDYHYALEELLDLVRKRIALRSTQDPEMVQTHIVELVARAMYEDEWGAWADLPESSRSVYRRRAAVAVTTLRALSGLTSEESHGTRWVAPADTGKETDR
ncbi:hypothetical protein B1813_18905 [Saccharomonospora piscinae]|uniref:Uncharacterized protein n=1 Tax=Saccharomonospora piscinae TaxID=687388 RepID=A0A1V8ZYP9_SACPI|nr:hypothetical protein [Saccharomonospora piscinae]OQO89911.1 hypothetical protein B1813_18905 [Saccharomonospora piscinae]